MIKVLELPSSLSQGEISTHLDNVFKGILPDDWDLLLLLMDAHKISKLRAVELGRLGRDPYWYDTGDGEPLQIEEQQLN